MTYGKLQANRQTPENRQAEAPSGRRVSCVGPLVNFLPQMKRLLLSLSERMGLREHMEKRSFIILDTETTSPVPETAVPWQLGAELWIDNECVDVFNEIISIRPEDFQKCPPDVREKIHLTWERIRRDGKPEKDVLAAFTAFFKQANGLPILGHNLRRFDIPILSLAYSRMSGRVVQLPMDRALDTGAIVKGGQVDCKLFELEEPNKFMDRVSGLRRRAVYWSLEYVTQQLEFPVDARDAHDALVDCRILKMLIDALIEFEDESGIDTPW